jgi:hypothetical protein
MCQRYLGGSSSMRLVPFFAAGWQRLLSVYQGRPRLESERWQFQRWQRPAGRRGSRSAVRAALALSVT